jgi:hypothetical protein
MPTGGRGGKKVGPGTDEAIHTFRRRRDSLGFDLSAVDGRLLAAALGAVTKNNAAIMFGSIAGGRGISVTVFQDGGKEREYAQLPEELEELLHDLIYAHASTSEDHYGIFGLEQPAGADRRNRDDKRGK